MVTSPLRSRHHEGKEVLGYHLTAIIQFTSTPQVETALHQFFKCDSAEPGKLTDWEVCDVSDSAGGVSSSYSDSAASQSYSLRLQQCRC